MLGPRPVNLGKVLQEQDPQELSSLHSLASLRLGGEGEV